MKYLRQGFRQTREPRAVLAAIVSALGLISAYGISQADESPWQMGARGLYSDFAQRSDAIPLLDVPANGIRAGDTWRAEIDAEYFLSPHFSGELSVGYPRSQAFRVTQPSGSSVGNFRELPLILTMKYDFQAAGPVRPYLGLGINWTHFSSVDLSTPNGPIELQKWRVGPALQGGIDMPFARHWYGNVDIKWSKLDSDVDLCCVKVSQMYLDPITVGVGIAYRFGGTR